MSNKYKEPFSLGFLYINNNLISKATLNDIKESLIIRERDYFTDEIKELNYYYEENNISMLPKFYQHVYGNIGIQQPNNFVCDGDDIEIINETQPRDEEQQKIIDHFVNKSDVGIIKAYTGFGKTYVFVKIMSILKKKTMIIVDRKKLANQWVKDITSFTNIKKEEIAMISGAETITDDNLNKPICIALVQTLASVADETLLIHNEHLKKFIKANYGLIGLDEVHKTGATPHFSKAALFFTSKKLIGLSATPRKSNDRANHILYSYFANSILFPDDSNQLRVTYNIVHYNSMISSKTHNWINFGNKYNYTRYRKKLLESESYKAMLLALCAMLVKDKNIIFVAHEIKHLETVRDMLIYYGLIKLDDAGIAIHGSDEKDLKKRFVFSTYGTMTAGLSLNHMNTLVLLTEPGASGTTIEQIKGRVTRDHTDKNANPLMFDLCDNYHQKISSKLSKREAEYERLKMIKSKVFNCVMTNDGCILEELNNT